MIRTATQAGIIYDVLIEHAGASEDDYARESFTYSVTSETFSEYRFQGSLGFGGKFYADFRVACYREDQTPERLEAVRATNEALKALKDEWSL